MFRPTVSAHHRPESFITSRLIPRSFHSRSAAVKEVCVVGGGGVIGIRARPPRGLGGADVAALDAGVRLRGHLGRRRRRRRTEAVCTAAERRALRDGKTSGMHEFLCLGPPHITIHTDMSKKSKDRLRDTSV